MELLTTARNSLVAVLKPLIDADPIAVRYTEFGAEVAPPATVIGPPIVNWTSYGLAPTDIDFQVFIVVAFNERTVETLMALVEPVQAALERIPGVTVVQAQPTTYAPADLPCYMLTANVPLS